MRFPAYGFSTALLRNVRIAFVSASCRFYSLYTSYASVVFPFAAIWRQLTPLVPRTFMSFFATMSQFDFSQIVRLAPFIKCLPFMLFRESLRPPGYAKRYLTTSAPRLGTVCRPNFIGFGVSPSYILSVELVHISYFVYYYRKIQYAIDHINAFGNIYLP